MLLVTDAFVLLNSQLCSQGELFLVQSVHLLRPVNGYFRFMIKFIIMIMNIFKLHRKWAWDPAQAQSFSGDEPPLGPGPGDVRDQGQAAPTGALGPGRIPGPFRCNLTIVIALIRFYIHLYMNLIMVGRSK